MGRQGGEVEEERLGFVLPLDLLHRLVADQRQVVGGLLQEFAVALPVDDAAAHLGEVVDLADEVAVEVIEAPVLWPVFLVSMAQVPLAHHRGLVARLLQRLRQGAFIGGQAVGVVGEDHQGLEAIAHRVATRHQGSARRRADGHAVEGLHPHAFPGQLVDVRRLDVAAPVAEIGIAEVVGHDENNVWPPPADGRSTDRPSSRPVGLQRQGGY